MIHLPRMDDDPACRPRLAIGSVLIALISMPLIFLFKYIELEFAVAFIGTLGFANAFIWSPAMFYMGIRIRSWIDTTCALIGMMTTVFWLWWIISG